MKTNHTSNTRIQWVDSMRGFSMIVVVLGHVLLSMDIGGYDSFLSTIFLTFRMPLFFFVSGFFSFRAIEWWNKCRTYNIIGRKFKAQIICTIVFYGIFLYSHGVSHPTGFGGYWFTIVLFQMYLIYLCCVWLSKITKFNIVFPILMTLSFIGVGILAANIKFYGIAIALCSENLCKYFQFFTFGLIVSRYSETAFKILSKNLFITISIIGWTVSMILWYSPFLQRICPLAYSLNHDIIARYFGLLSIIAFFYSNRNHLSSGNKYCAGLRLIGQRTLDVYMLHYFFIPDLKILHSWLAPANMIIIQLVISLSITAAIVILCIIISSFVRESRFLRMWLFGTKS